MTISRKLKMAFAGVLATALLVTSLSCGSNGGGTAKPDGGTFKTEGKGYRFVSNGWIYLHVEGAPYERGFQNGRLVAKEMDSMRRALTRFYYYDSDLRWSHIVESAKSVFAGKVPPELDEEMRGIADGAKAAGVNFPYEEVLALNGLVEITENWWPNVQSGKLPDVDSAMRCSAFVATGKYTSDGKVVMGHNTWSSYMEAQSYNVILDIVPDKGHRMLMQAAPGTIQSGADFFVTDARIMGTETTIGDIEKFDPQGTPEFVRVREAMQYAGNIDEFVSIMKKDNNGGYANSWLLADAVTGEILRYEQGLEHQPVERTKSGYYVGFNSASDPDLRNLETADNQYFNVKTTSGARRVRLEALMKDYKGELDLESAKRVLSDHYDVYLDQEKPGLRTIEGRSDMDDRKFSTGNAYSPSGAVDGKVMDSSEALKMSFQGRWGSSSGLPFDTGTYFQQHPQFDYMRGYLVDRPTEPWTLFNAGMK